MQRLAALLSSNICTVLMLLLLIFLSLPAAFAQPMSAAQSSSMHSQHESSASVVIDCDADCAGTVHHCCLYALVSQQALPIFQPNTVRSSLLSYFFSSRDITPLTQPPKTTSS
ncbi:hypothetical protein [Denitrificimonas caeni]|uniref:hypothetical protein n=1 Tax=Denitrificimonas caeni TaxID=521720 RepID=UPI001966899B|nr:hypothetical protein [Denitrificimonas caeni]